VCPQPYFTLASPKCSKHNRKPTKNFADKIVIGSRLFPDLERADGKGRFGALSQLRNSERHVVGKPKGPLQIGRASRAVPHLPYVPQCLVAGFSISRCRSIASKWPSSSVPLTKQFTAANIG
jgi:hypothetical protein